jgi:hypothetical protein
VLSGPVGFFTGGTPGLVAATRVRAWWLNMIQEEIIAVLVAAGLTPDTAATNFHQLRDAITTMVGAGRLLNVQAFAASGTCTVAAGATIHDVFVLGGGAPGSGVPATGAGQAAVGAGGGSGAHGRGRYAAAVRAITVGAAGVPALGGVGTNGGSSSYGASLSAPGGIAGGFAPAAGPPIDASGSGATISVGGNIYNSGGPPGQLGVAQNFTSELVGGNGASSPMGAGGTGGAGTNGGAAVGVGAGGGGASNLQSSGALTGGTAGAGYVIVAEYS